MSSKPQGDIQERNSSASSTHSAGHKVGAPAPALLAVQTIQRAYISPTQLTPAEVLQLQRTMGNRVVTQLVRAPSRSQPTTPAQSTVIQRKPPKTLKLSEFGDKKRDKVGGTKPGAWHERKGQEWLVKHASGYGTIRDPLPTDVSKEVMALREAMAGDLYRLVLGKHNTPRTRLVESEQSPKYWVASKGIGHFQHYRKSIEETNQGDYMPSIESFGKKESMQAPSLVQDQAGFTRAYIASLFFGDNDVKEDNIGKGDSYVKSSTIGASHSHANEANIGTSHSNAKDESIGTSNNNAKDENVGTSHGGEHFKIDHGGSLDHAFTGMPPKLLVELLGNMPPKISIERVSAPVHQGAKLQVLERIAHIEDQEIEEIVVYYAKLLEPYRRLYGPKLNYIVGDKDDFFYSDIIAKRNAVREFVKGSKESKNEK